MKKTALVFAIVLGFSLCSFAQNGGGLFGYGEKPADEEETNNVAWYSFNQNEEVDNGLFGHLRTTVMPGLPNHGQDENQDAPLTGGTLLFIGLGTVYAIKKKRQ